MLEWRAVSCDADQLRWASGQWIEWQQQSRCRAANHVGSSQIVMALRRCIGPRLGCFAVMPSASQHLCLPRRDYCLLCRLWLVPPVDAACDCV